MIPFHVILAACTIGLAAWLMFPEDMGMAIRRVLHRASFVLGPDMFTTAFVTGVEPRIVTARRCGTGGNTTSRRRGPSRGGSRTPFRLTIAQAAAPHAGLAFLF